MTLLEWSDCLRSGLKGLACATLAFAAAVAPPAMAAEPIRLALIEAFSGPFAASGEFTQRNLQFAIERVNARGGVQLPEGKRLLELELLDSKGQTDEALLQFQNALSIGAPFILQGNSSTVAGALSETVARHNQREPNARVLFLNFGAVDPALTNERCQPWHFRFDAHVDMRMAALVQVVAQSPEVRRVYLINQDYSFGHNFARAAREQLAAVRPDIAVVGEDLHPIGRVTDFAPYIAKIRASGADTIMTGNWGPDLSLLVRAARDAGLQANFLTFFANSLGAPAAMGDAGVGRTLAVSEWHPNAGDAAMAEVHAAFRARWPRPQDDYLNARKVWMVEMLVQAIEQAGSVQADAVAAALSGMRYQDLGADLTMRSDDHQAVGPLYVFRMERQGTQGAEFDQEGSGFGFVTAAKVPAAQLEQPHRCQMASWAAR